MTDLVFKLARTAALNGHVYDEDGEPVRGALVSVFRASAGLAKPSQIGDGPTPTNDLGEFRVFDLPPGRYLVSVFYHPGNEWSRGFRKPAPTVGYLPSFYPNTTDASKAQALIIHPGDEVHALDFSLRPASFVSVSGKIVVGPPTITNTFASVSLYPRDAGLAEDTVNLEALSDPKTGAFKVDNVPPGAYYIGVSYRDRDSGAWLLTRRELDVANVNVEGIMLSLLPGLDIPGKIVWDGSPPRELHLVQLLLTPIDKSLPGPEWQTVKSDGTFVLKNVSEGDYHIVLMFGALPLGFLKSVRYGSTSLSDGVLNRSPGFRCFSGTNAQRPHRSGFWARF